MELNLVFEPSPKIHEFEKICYERETKRFKNLTSQNYIVFFFLGVSFVMAFAFIYKASCCTSLNFSSFIFCFEFNFFLLLKFLCTLFLHFTLLFLVEIF
jgi:hypothetical protein